MKHFTLAAAIAASLALLAIPGIAAANVGVSVSIGQPGFYGRIDMGGFPQPMLVYPQPVIVQPVPLGMIVSQPIYLHVRPGQAKNWRRHCNYYGACGQPVYFVQNGWYNNIYVPRYREHDYYRGEYRGSRYYKKHRRDYGDYDG